MTPSRQLLETHMQLLTKYCLVEHYLIVGFFFLPEYCLKCEIQQSARLSPSVDTFLCLFISNVFICCLGKSQHGLQILCFMQISNQRRLKTSPHLLFFSKRILVDFSSFALHLPKLSTSFLHRPLCSLQFLRLFVIVPKS